MRNWLKYVIAFASAFALMMAVRTLAVSVHYVNGDGLSPLYSNGDCLLINRCSYGLRIEGNGLLPYSRLMRQPVRRGDIVAFTMPCDSLDGKAFDYFQESMFQMGEGVLILHESLDGARWLPRRRTALHMALPHRQQRDAELPGTPPTGHELR